MPIGHGAGLPQVRACCRLKEVVEQRRLNTAFSPLWLSALQYLNVQRFLIFDGLDEPDQDEIGQVRRRE